MKKEITCQKVYCMIDRENYPENIRVDVYEHEVPILRSIHGEKMVKVMDEAVREVIKHSGDSKPRRVKSVSLDFEDEMTRMRNKYGGNYEQMARTYFMPKVEVKKDG